MHTKSAPWRPLGGPRDSFGREKIYDSHPLPEDQYLLYFQHYAGLGVSTSASELALDPQRVGGALLSDGREVEPKDAQEP